MNIKSKLDYRYIYILGNSRYLFRYKIGIAKSIENRTKGIESTLRGTTYEIFAVKMFFAMRIEQLLHLIYSPLSAKMRGSGKTEWFWMILPVTPMLFLIILWVLQWVLIPLLIVGAAYAWLHWL
ncbi:MAG: GIY-YIG nuclease family protein [Saprospiraceae bacterium]|nr:GIY-YIG nuclease family protein [Saprospiraceae bacterium]